jgi:hypothetical protein
MAFNLAKTLGLAPARSKFRADQEAATAGLGSMLPTYQSQAATAGQTASTFDPLRTSSAKSLYDRYAKGFDGGGLLKKKLMGGIDSRFASATANARTQAMNAGANPASTLALMGAKRAQALSGALSNYEAQKMGEDERFARNAYGVASDMYGRGLGEQRAALGSQGNIYGQQFNQFGNLAQADEARQNAGRQALMNLIQTGASLYGAGRGTPRAMPQSLPDNGNPGGEEFIPFNALEAPYDASGRATMPYELGGSVQGGGAGSGFYQEPSMPTPTLTQALIQQMRQPRMKSRLY